MTSSMIAGINTALILVLSPAQREGAHPSMEAGWSEYEDWGYSEAGEVSETIDRLCRLPDVDSISRCLWKRGLES